MMTKSFSRVRCLVPHCNRTTGEDFAEWICTDHWRATPTRLRKLWHRAKRRPEKKSFASYLWLALKIAAIERAMGNG